MTLVLVNPHAQGGRVRRLLPALREAADELLPFARVQIAERVDEALALLRRENPGTRVVLIGKGPMLFTSVLNTPSYGSGLPAVPDARIDDGQLDWLRAGPFGPAGTLAMLPRLAIGAHLGHPMVQTARFTTLDIRCEAGVPLAADGEWLGLARQLQISTSPAGLQVVKAPH